MDDLENLKQLVFVLFCILGFIGTTFYLMNKLKKSIDKKYPTPNKLKGWVIDSECTFTPIKNNRITLKPKTTRVR